MTKTTFPPLPEALLGELTVHELVRDFPELLQVLESAGVPFQESGGRPLTLEGGSPSRLRPTLKEEIRGASAWRGHNGGGKRT